MTPSSHRYVAGIDPGLKGAVALVPIAEGQDIVTYDMPTYEITRGKKKRNEIDLYELARFFDLHAATIKLATIENPHSMPEQGIASAETFGRSIGIALMAVAAHFVPMTLVPPATWKRAMGLTSDKDASRRLASRMFPTQSHQWARAKDDGRAEAVLLAVYGAKL